MYVPYSTAGISRPRLLLYDRYDGARRMVCSVRPFAYGRGPLALLTGCSGLVCEMVGVACPCEPEIGEVGKQDLCSGGWSKLLLGWFCLDLAGRVLVLG
jgi:hypothetical protein